MTSLYRWPALYDRLLAPADAEITQIDGILRSLGWEPQGLSVFDPACGPGTRLRRWAQAGSYVAGQDREPAMIAEARTLFAAHPSEWICGDMRSLAFSRRDFDLALNLDSSVGHLPDDQAILEHLHSVAGHLRPGGLYLLTVPLLESRMLQTRPLLLFESGWHPVPTGGRASVAYTSLRRDPFRRRETIHLSLSFDPPESPASFAETLSSFCEEYELLTFSRTDLQTLLASTPSFRLLQIRSLEDEGLPLVSWAEASGDLLLVLRREQALCELSEAP